jgi:hypothetical protein
MRWLLTGTAPTGAAACSSECPPATRLLRAMRPSRSRVQVQDEPGIPGGDPPQRCAWVHLGIEVTGPDRSSLTSPGSTVIGAPGLQVSICRPTWSAPRDVDAHAGVCVALVGQDGQRAGSAGGGVGNRGGRTSSRAQLRSCTHPGARGETRQEAALTGVMGQHISCACARTSRRSGACSAIRSAPFGMRARHGHVINLPHPVLTE